MSRAIVHIGPPAAQTRKLEQPIRVNQRRIWRFLVPAKPPKTPRKRIVAIGCALPGCVSRTGADPPTVEVIVTVTVEVIGPTIVAVHV
jgi:hypothetical protein